MAVSLPFAQGWYVSESLPISAQECINFYPNVPQTGTLTTQSLFGSPGIAQIAQAAEGESNRGTHKFNEIPYGVNADKLYRIDRNIDAFGNVSYAAVEVGSGIDGVDRVIIADNGPLLSETFMTAVGVPINSVSLDGFDGQAIFNVQDFGVVYKAGTIVIITGFVANPTYNGTFLIPEDGTTSTFKTGVDFTGDEATGQYTATVPGAAGQMCIITPETDNQFNAYIYTENEGLNQINSPSFDGPVSYVTYVDGYFLFTKKDGKKFFISALNNGFSYNALDFAAANVDTDPIRAAFVLRNEVFIFGSETVEPFQNIGGSGFPFVRIEGGVQDKGLDAPLSIVELNGNMVWIGSADRENIAIWMSNGGVPQKISTTAIENEIQNYNDVIIQRSFATNYSQDGQIFVAFSFPGQKTFLYDIINGLWHTRESTINEVQNEWRVSGIEQAYGELIVGDQFSNAFGIIDKETFTEFGELIKRRFVLPPLDNEGNPFFNNSVELVGETGQGDIVSPTVDPEVRLSFSDDGGRTFGDSIPRSFGKVGEYNQRCIWDQLGRVPRSRMYRFDCSDPVKWAFYKVEANID